MRDRGVLLEVELAHGVHEARAVGRKLKGAGTFHGPEILGGDGARRGLGGEGGAGDQASEAAAGSQQPVGGSDRHRAP